MRTNRRGLKKLKLISQALITLMFVLTFISCAGIKKRIQVHEMALKPGATSLHLGYLAVCLISLKTRHCGTFLSI